MNKKHIFGLFLYFSKESMQRGKCKMQGMQSVYWEMGVAQA